MGYVTGSFGLSIRKACGLVGLSKSVFWYKHKPKREDEDVIRQRLKELAQKRTRFGCPRLHVLLQREGFKMNHKRTERIYREEKLSLKRKRKRKTISGLRLELPKPEGRNHIWSMDFVADRTVDGRKLKVLTIVDEFTRKCHRTEVDTSITGARVCRVLEEIGDQEGFPGFIITDNGPEFAGKALDEWAYQRKIKLSPITPGKPIENAYIESFNGRFRDECLNEHWFVSLAHARQIIEEWRMDYNHFRPHSSLGNLSPEEFIKKEVRTSACSSVYSIS